MCLLGYLNLQKVADLLGAVFASFIPVSTKAGAECEYCWRHLDPATLTNVRDSDHRIPAHRRSSIHTLLSPMDIPAEKEKNMSLLTYIKVLVSLRP